MQCPVCDQQLRAIERSGIKVDIRPGCKGLWLDRGELDKLIALEGGTVQQSQSAVPSREEPRERHDDEGGEDDDFGDQRQGNGQGQRKKRGSWLSNILESFGGD